MMLQRQETAHLRMMLDEEFARSLTDEDILGARSHHIETMDYDDNHPPHLNPFYYAARAHGEHFGEEDYNSEEEDDLDHMSYEELLALGDRIGTVSKGATKAQISQCPERRYDGGSVKEKTCSVCQEDFQAGVMLRTLPCLHSYHSQCIDQWLAMQAKCPVCQHSIKE